MSDISFFVPTGPFNINELSKDFASYKDKILIKDLKTLDKANKNHIMRALVLCQKADIYLKSTRIPAPIIIGKVLSHL